MKIALDLAIVKGATIAASSSGNTVVVPAVPGRMIAGLQLALSAENTVAVKFQSNTTNITGLFYITTGNCYFPAGGELAWFMTARGEALNINLSGNVAVGGVLQYIEID